MRNKIDPAEARKILSAMIKELQEIADEKPIDGAEIMLASYVVR